MHADACTLARAWARWSLVADDALMDDALMDIAAASANTCPARSSRPGTGAIAAARTRAMMSRA
jgi:hypothetical protein